MKEFEATFTTNRLSRANFYRCDLLMGRMDKIQR